MTLANSIRYVSAQPDEGYFLWQSRVYLENFRALGIPLARCVAIFGVQPGSAPSAGLQALRRRFPEVDVRIFEDTRGPEGRHYAASIQPHLIVKALEAQPEWEGEPTFFHDSDIVFRRLPDFNRLLREHPRACLLSDTINYIGFDYLHGVCEALREEIPELPADDLIRLMCGTVGIDVETVRRNNAVSGGAQYLLQGVGRDYWNKVYRDSIALWDLFVEYLGGLGLAKPPGDYLQIWTAGMWAYLWNLWLLGSETVLHPEMKFVFGSAASEEEATILHMAGLPVPMRATHFNKPDWRQMSPDEFLARQPYLFDHIPKGSVAHEYVSWIREAAGVPLTGVHELAPARQWRLLVWKTDGDAPIWDVERLDLHFDPAVSVVNVLESGNAGEPYQAQNAFVRDDRFWGGRPDSRDGQRPSLYLGVELDQDAVPDRVTLTQADSAHVARVAILQRRNCEGDWLTVHVASLEPRLVEQTVFYRSAEGHCARGWRIVATATSSGFAWDALRLRFLHNEDEMSGAALSSGYADDEDASRFGPANAFSDGYAYWGGRHDGRRFYVGLEAPTPVRVNRVSLLQGEEHWAPSVEIQELGPDGQWRSFRTVENLGPGLNDILLFDA